MGSDRCRRRKWTMRLSSFLRISLVVPAISVATLFCVLLTVPFESRAQDGPAPAAASPSKKKPARKTAKTSRKKEKPATRFTYSICHNDTVKTVAELLGVSEEDLRRWNQNTVRRGRFVKGTRRVTYYAQKGYQQESIGRASSGRLVGGVNLDCDGDDRGSGWVVLARRVNTYGTPETIHNIQQAGKAYRSYFRSRKQKYPPLAIGDLSRRDGGPLPPHLSHQSGRDVDVGVINVGNRTPGAFIHTTPKTMDTLKTWVMLKSFLDTGEVQYIFMARSLAGEIKTYVSRIYAKDQRKRRHYLKFFDTHVISGDGEHYSHVHIRFKCPKGDKQCIP